MHKNPIIFVAIVQRYLQPLVKMTYEYGSWPPKKNYSESPCQILLVPVYVSIVMVIL